MRGLSRTTEKFRVGVTSKLRQSTKFVDGIYKMTLPPGSKVWRCSPKHPETKFNSLRWFTLSELRNLRSDSPPERYSPSTVLRPKSCTCCSNGRLRDFG